MEKLCKALTAEYKVKYPMRYRFKVKKSKGLPEITWYRLILHRFPDEELEEKEVEVMKQEIEKIKEMMEVETQAFIQLAKPFLSEWYEKMIKETVINNPEIAHQADKTGQLSQLKKDLLDLQEKT